MEKLAANLSVMKKIAEIYTNRHQVALLLPNGLIEVIGKGNVTFFESISAMAKHSIGSKIMTDEIIDLTFQRRKERIMEDTMMYEAVMITSADIDVLRISNSQMLLKQYLSIFIQNYIRESFDAEIVAVVRGENSYTILRKNNDFVAAFKIRSIECILASPKELAKEEKEIEETAKNAE